MKIRQFFTRSFSFAAIVFYIFPAFISCSDKNDDPDPDPISSNPAAYVTDKSKLFMLRSMKELENGKGRFYEINYTADYKLDKALEAEVVNVTDITKFLISNLFDTPTKSVSPLSFDAGCSAFSATETGTGAPLMGRNFDFCHKISDTQLAEITAILVRTAPKGDKKSISMVDSYFLSPKYVRGFYTDGQTDLSNLMALPYVPLDGINEDGFAIGILKLDGFSAKEQESGKPFIGPTLAIRMLLDKASDVESAVELLKRFNIDMDTMGTGESSYHFFMADAKGKYAIVEYVDPQGRVDVNPWKIDVLDGEEYRFTTNFYNSPAMKNSIHGGLSNHGRARYDTLKTVLSENSFMLDKKAGMDLLQSVSQKSDPNTPTSQTQWSALFDLSQRRMRLALLADYGKIFEFEVK